MAGQQSRTLFGEPVELLLEALRCFELQPTGSGRVHVHGELPEQPGSALVRGLEDRSQAALLLLLRRLHREQRREVRRAPASQRH